MIDLSEYGYVRMMAIPHVELFKPTPSLHFLLFVLKFCSLLRFILCFNVALLLVMAIVVFESLPKYTQDHHCIYIYIAYISAAGIYRVPIPSILASDLDHSAELTLNCACWTTFPADIQLSPISAWTSKYGWKVLVFVQTAKSGR